MNASSVQASGCCPSSLSKTRVAAGDPSAVNEAAPLATIPGLLRVLRILHRPHLFLQRRDQAGTTPNGSAMRATIGAFTVCVFSAS